MSVRFTQDAENERVERARQVREQNKKSSWEYFKSMNLVETLHYAKDHGWKKKKVQVKAFPMNEYEVEYYVEPYEKDCRCPNLLHYEDYFD